MRITSRFLVTLALAAGAGAQAQTAPPIKPGLWQVQMQHEGAAAEQMPDMSEHLKNMSPEQRKQVEAMMKSHGVDIAGGPGQMKICLSKESLDQGRWQGDQGRCKTDMTHRSATSWRWHSVCTDPKSESDGEAIFSDAESYVVKSSTTMTVQGEARTTKSTLNSKWLGADCGDIKPVHAPKKSPG